MVEDLLQWHPPCLHAARHDHPIAISSYIQAIWLVLSKRSDFILSKMGVLQVNGLQQPVLGSADHLSHPCLILIFKRLLSPSLNSGHLLYQQSLIHLFISLSGFDLESYFLAFPIAIACLRWNEIADPFCESSTFFLVLLKFGVHLSSTVEAQHDFNYNWIASTQTTQAFNMPQRLIRGQPDALPGLNIWIYQLSSDAVISWSMFTSCLTIVSGHGSSTWDLGWRLIFTRLPV